MKELRCSEGRKNAQYKCQLYMLSRGCQLLQYFLHFIFLGIIIPAVGRLALVQKSADCSKENLAYNITTYRNLPVVNITRKVSTTIWIYFHNCVDCDAISRLIFEPSSSCHLRRIFLWWRDAYSWVSPLQQSSWSAYNHTCGRIGHSHPLRMVLPSCTAIVRWFHILWYSAYTSICGMKCHEYVDMTRFLLQGLALMTLPRL